MIVANGVTAAHAARKVTTTVPIVMVGGADPVEAGLAASLARPGGNVTGLTSISVELIGKRVELLKEVLPRLSRIGALWDPESRMEPVSLKAVELAARSLGVQVQAVEVRRREDLETAFGTMVGQRAEAFFQVPSNLLQAHRARVVELATRHRLPSIFGAKEYVEAGGLMSYGPDNRDLWRRAATHVDRILKGAQPGDLPFEQATKLELVINLKTARALGLTIPPSLLFRADQTIE
jgi:ABC-type uncharacterized transport system substrate-binding protein